MEIADAVPFANSKEEMRALLDQRASTYRQNLDHLLVQVSFVQDETTSLEATGDREDEEAMRRVSFALKRGITCRHSCAHHTALMDPALWSGLPKDLLQLVFARLPLPHIIHLQCLSKEWKWNVRAAKSGFRQACASASASASIGAAPKMFALVSEADCDDCGVFSVRVYDIKSNRWHAFNIFVAEDLFDTMCASDGGLVCFISRTKNREENPMLIIVCNPLTKEWKILPSHSLGSVQPKMVQLVMNRETKCYQVIVVVQNTTGVVAEVYSSNTGLWSSTTNSLLGLIFGYEYYWDPARNVDNFFLGVRLLPCVYDCREGQLLELGDSSNPFLGFREAVKGHALVRDHLFVLHEEMHEMRIIGGQVWRVSRYCISEYRGNKGAPNWVKLRVHSCSGFESPPRSASYSMRLHACEGFLLVVANNNESGSYRQDLAWLYDLSKCKWRTLPNMPRGAEYSSEDIMCELQWDAVPGVLRIRKT